MASDYCRGACYQQVALVIEWMSDVRPNVEGRVAELQAACARAISLLELDLRAVARIEQRLALAKEVSDVRIVTLANDIPVASG